MSRVEMHLVSQRAQEIRIGDAVIELAAGEAIVTEHSYKHTLHAMRAILIAAGWQIREVHTGQPHPFRLWLCEASGPRAAISTRL